MVMKTAESLGHQFIPNDIAMTEIYGLIDPMLTMCSVNHLGYYDLEPPQEFFYLLVGIRMTS